MSQPKRSGTGGSKAAKSRQPAGQPKHKNGEPKKPAGATNASQRTAIGRKGVERTSEAIVAGRQALTSAILAGKDPGRIIAEAERLKRGGPKPKRAAAVARKRKPLRQPTELPAAGQTKASGSFRIRNGDVDDLRSEADRRLAKSEGTRKHARPKSPAPTERKCRECLRVKPVKAFPSRAAVCAECGGQPRSKSVRTISGGLPTTGRRR